MPVMIEELNTTFDVQDDAKIRRIVRQEVRAALSSMNRGSASTRERDATDPGAGSASGEGRFG